MKKTIATLAAAALAVSMLAGCGSSAASTAPAAPAASAASAASDTDSAVSQPAGESLKVSLLVNGSFGDKAFNDSSKTGMDQLAADFAGQVEVEELESGSDKTKWEGALLDLSESDSDIIIVGTWDFKELVEKIAPQFPDKRYIIFDTDVDYTIADLSNVYSMSYMQNEAAFLAGVLAAGVTTSDMEHANADAIVGFVGAKDTAAVINDYAVGYIEGAQFVNPDVKVLVSYVGSYVDSATAKELALTQYNSGADCVFVAAGPSSVGVIEAAAESEKYVIGVDSDQALAYEGQPEADFIISSALKNVGTSIYDSVVASMSGELAYGEYRVLGLEDGAVGMADNAIYQAQVPEEIRQSVEDAKAAVMDGSTTVDTAFGMDEATLQGIISGAQ